MLGRLPDTPPRDFEIRILKWIGLPLVGLIAVGFITWAWQVRSGRAACEEQCSNAGKSGFIFIPEDPNVGRAAECVCKD